MTGIAGLAEFIRDKVNVKKGAAKPKLGTETKAQLKAIFKDDVERLEGLIGKDLSHWK